MRCVSCHKNVKTEDNWTKFACPACEKAEIIRCEGCRRRSMPYVCKECGFEGP
jgi:hypothetical protein